MTLNVLIALTIGFLIGVGFSFVIRLTKEKNVKEIARQLINETEIQRREDENTMIENLKNIFGNLSMEALSKSTEEFLKLAKQKLDSERDVNSKILEEKKVLIDRQIQNMNEELKRVMELINVLENDREKKFGQLSENLKNANEQVKSLTKTANSLHEILSNTKVRGQWGERMAEDVLRIAGFRENINYVKQTTVDSGSRPDFTFFLPKDLKLNMDVKFPLNNYIKYVESSSESDKKNFLKDVKNRIKEITTRDYINPSQNTIDFVILFIPNEQVYEFVNQEEPGIIDYALQNKVIVCSPITLFAVLSIIRQSIDNFSFQKASREILSILGTFNKEWERFTDKLESLGKKIDSLSKEYGTLVTTRKKALEKSLNKIDDIRVQKGLPVDNVENNDANDNS